MPDYVPSDDELTGGAAPSDDELLSVQPVVGPTDDELIRAHLGTSAPEAVAQTASVSPDKPKGWAAVLEDMKRGPSMGARVFGPAGVALEGFQSFKHNILDPQVIDPLQSAARSAYTQLPAGAKYALGTPLFRSAQEIAAGEIPPGALESADANVRKWGQLILGDPNNQTLANQMTDEQKLKGINSREGGTNPTLDAVGDFAAQEIPKLPLYMLGTGWLGRAEEAGILTKSLIHAGEGALGGILGEAVLSGGNVVEGGVAGAALGFGGTLVGAGAKAGAKKLGQFAKGAEEALAKRPPVTVATVSPDAIPSLREEMKAAPEGPVEKPAAIVVFAKADGTAAAREVGLVNGEMVSREIPVEDVKVRAAQKNVSVLQEPAVAPSPTDTKVINDAAGPVAVDPNKTPLARPQREVGRDIPSTEAVKREYLQKLVSEPGFYEAQVERVRAFDEKGTTRVGQRVVMEPDGSTVRFETLDDPALQREAMRRSGLVELNNGKLAYVGLMGETPVLWPLENGHPRSIKALEPLDSSRIKRGFNIGGEPHRGGISDNMLDEIAAGVPKQEAPAVPPSPPEVPPPASIPPPPAPPPPPPPGPHTIHPNLGLESEVSTKLEKMGAAFRDSFVGPHSQGPRTVAQEALRIGTVKRLGLTAPEHFQREAIRTFGLESATPEFKKDLYRALEKGMTPDELGAKYPKMTAEAQKALKEYLSLVETNNARLHAVGAPIRLAENPDATTALGHLHRAYFKNTLEPGEWARTFKATEKNAMERLKKTIVRDMLSGVEHGGKSFEDKNRLADDIIDQVLGDERYLKDQELRRLAGDKAVNSMKPRADLRPSVDDLIAKYPEQMASPQAKNLMKARQTGVDIKPRAKALLTKLELDPKADAKFTRAIKDLTEEHELSRVFRTALGEIKDPGYALGQTLARQESLIAALGPWDHLSKYGLSEGLFAPKGTMESAIPAEGWRTIPDDPARFGNAAGGWIKTSLFDQLEHNTEIAQGLGRHATRFSRWMKFNQVTGAAIGAVWNQTMGNLGGAMMGGRPKALLRFGDSIRNFLAWHENPSAETPAVLRHKLALSFGFGSSGFGRNEAGIAANTWKNDLRKLFLQKMTEQGKVTAWDVLDLQMRKLGSLAGKGVNTMGTIVDAPDQLFKTASFNDNLDWGGLSPDMKSVDRKKAAVFLGDQFQDGLTDKEVIRRIQGEAALRVSDGYPMMDRPAPGAKITNDMSAVLGLNSYMGIVQEQYRNMGRFGQRLAKDPQAKWQLAQWAAIMGSGYAALAAGRKFNGLSKETIADAESRLSPGDKRFKPAKLALPFRDSKGDVVFLDFTNSFLPLSWLAGNSQETGVPDVLKNTLRNIAFQPVTSGFMGTEISEGLAQLGLLNELPYDPDLRAWQMNGYSLVDQAWKRGVIGPTFIPKIVQNLQQAGAIGTLPPGAVPITPEVTAARILTGNHVMTPQAPAQSFNQSAGKFRGDTKTARDWKRFDPNYIEGPATGLRGLFGAQPDPVEEYINARQRAMNDFEKSQK